MVTVALIQSVVLLHGACCLGDQLLSWACSEPATSLKSDGDPCEEMLEVSEAGPFEQQPERQRAELAGSCVLAKKLAAL